ncbi:MAG: ABC transporter permease [Oligoflexia bacterium]|nr:ABC transporter permease [Oligoflexia bacterium]
MSLLLRIATRNLFRNFRRSAITMLTISFGLAVILWLQCVLEGRNRHIIESITTSYTGNLQLFHKNYLEDRLINLWFSPDRNLIESTLPKGTYSAERVHLPSLVSSGENSVPILLEGIEPAKEAEVTNVRKNLIAGKYLEDDPSVDCESRQIYIGKKLSDLLKVSVGNKIVILAQAADGSLGNDLFRISGIFDSGSPDFDKSFAFAPINCVKKVGALYGIHEISIRIPNLSDEPKIKSALKKILPENIEISSWRESLPSMATMVKYNDATLVMISSMLLIVITLGIVNTLLMSVFERTREFGVMISLGTTPTQVRMLIVFECLVLGVISSILGIIIGFVAVIYHQKYGFDLRPFLGDHSSLDQFRLDLTIYPVFQFIPFLKAVLWMMFFIILAGVYPAWRASKLEPVEAMRSV